MTSTWERLRLPAAEPAEPRELFHENSKTTRYTDMPPEAAVIARMQGMWETLPYSGRRQLPLPPPLETCQAPLLDTIRRRVSARAMTRTEIALDALATLLYAGYGVTRDNAGTAWPRPFRTVPSGGALYPLEIYLHAASVGGLTAGLYHYDPGKHLLHELLDRDQTDKLAGMLVQPELAWSASVLFCLTAIPERSCFKYSDRGYRFLLLEAGHVAQNINLVATALGLGVLNVGGYLDHEIDSWLGIDGVTQSAVYLVAVGSRAPDPATGTGEHVH